MDYTGDPESNQHPNQHDRDQLDTIYHNDPGSFNSWAPAPVDDGSAGGKGNGGGKGKNGKNGEVPGLVISAWGNAISTDGKGRPDLFELDLGNGNKVFTHVFSAD